MNSDSIFLKGNTHLVCQDFAINSSIGEYEDEYSEIIVADGCSTFKEGSDIYPNNYACIASRLACLAASSALANSDDPLRCLTSRMFLDAIQISIENICKHILIRPSKLATTLLTAITIDELVISLFIGDGVMVYEYNDCNNDSCYIIYTREYIPNIPMNITYLHDTAHKRYDSNSVIMIQKKYYIIDNTIKTIEKFNYNNNIHSTENLLIVDKRELKSISLFTDGIMSFSNNDFINNILKFVKFKSRKGSFVKRRVLMQIEEFKKEGIFHSDDFSMATINFE